MNEEGIATDQIEGDLRRLEDEAKTAMATSSISVVTKANLLRRVNIKPK